MMRLLQLGQELEWQVLQLRRAGSEAQVESGAEDGLGPAIDDPSAGTISEALVEQQRTVIATADKIQREILSTVRFDPLRLVGVGGPIAETLDSVADLIVALDEIRCDATRNVGGLPHTVRSLQGLLRGYCEEGTPAAA
ncbi:MAG TPA: hypothetical protein VMT20_06255 [Terriglobia bacterium]|nr:hypothetical protein [Terriglobia bacterium]